MVDPGSGAKLKVLVFAASLRAGSLNRKLAALAARVAEQNGVTVEHTSMREFDVPSFDGDVESAQGPPAGAQELRRRLMDNDAFIVSSPEYNGSMPPLLKNTIDWVSRVSKDGGRPLKAYPGRVVAICSSSEGHFAGIRSANHLRAVLSHIGMEVIAPQVSVPRGGEAFDEVGEFRDERLAKGMARLCSTLIQHARLLSTRTEA